jgi:DNA-binding NarL/FixJ family response regulator
VSIPLLLVCDGGESKQATLEGLVKNEPGLKYIATVSMQEGTTAVERAVKVGAKLIWIDLDEEPVEGLNLLAETRKLHPALNVIVSRSQLDPDMVRAALQLGALDFLDSARAAQQLNVVVENLKTGQNGSQTNSTISQTAAPAAPAQAAAPQPAPQAGGSRWGDLDSIPTPGATAAPAPAPAPQPAPMPQPAQMAPPQPVGAQAAPLTRPAAQDVTGEINVSNSGIQNLVAAQAPAQPAPQAAANPSAGGSKWGDLDSIGAPSAASAPAAAAAPQMAAPPMPAPQQAPQPAAQPAPQPAEQPAAPQAAATASSGGGNRWGDLDAIPTPKVTTEIPKPEAPLMMTGGGGSLDAIRTPTDKSAAPLPKPVPHSNTNKALRPSPEKAELYSMGSPVMMAIVILIIIIAAIAFMMLKGHH